MFKLFTEKDVKNLVLRLKTEYDEVLCRQHAFTEELKEENRNLKAKILEFERERSDVSSALVHAVKEGERVKAEGAEAAEGERKELKLLSEKCRLLLDRLLAKYPDEEDVRDFEAFVSELKRQLGEEREEETSFNMDDVLAPKEPLDLEKLCKDLGLMEDLS